MQRAVKVVAAFALHLLVAQPVLAQSQNSSITGTVRDAGGGVLPGVTVEISSPVLIEKVRSTVTDERGDYRVIELRPGAYSVTFALPGFRSVRREGIELTPAFTATVNAELAVGALEETVTVSGQSPVVDVQSVVQTKSLSRELLDQSPIGSKSPLALAALMPAIIVQGNMRDVGGSRGESNGRLVIHGGHPNDQKLLVDGMRVNNMQGDGPGRAYFMNPASAEEVTIAIASGGSAEFASGGVQINLIPKDGGNSFSGYFFTTNTTGALQDNNLSEALQARGLQTTNRIRYLYDVNAAAGGPIRQDRLWFYTAHRRWGDKNAVANLFLNATQGSLDKPYTPDLNSPVEQYNWYKSHNLRLSSQVSTRNKLTFFGDYQEGCNCSAGAPLTSANAQESVVGWTFRPNYVLQGTWMRTHSQRILFEAGATVMRNVFNRYRQANVALEDISILEQTNNFRYNAPITFGTNESSQMNQRFSMSFVTGTHNIKVGLFALEGVWEESAQFNPAYLSYTYSAGSPVQLTQHARTERRLLLRPDFALFAQDQWRVNRLTLNYGLRFDYLNGSVPGNTQPASRFLGVRSFEEVDCVPCWMDLSPRFAAAYDLFGNGRTALKANISRYVQSYATSIQSASDPVLASVNQVNRAWNDADRDFFPDCDLANPVGNGECQQFANVNFGNPNVTTRYDPEVVTGWQKRPYQWQTSATLEHQLGPGIAVNVGYFRTWYGNFHVTDNLAVTPADFTEYCITAPVHPDLPGGGGERICGLYDVNPGKFGQVNNLITFASNYGRQTHTFNGVDVGINARLPRRIVVSGGVAVGNSSGGPAIGISSTSRCFVVDSPQELRFCDVPTPQQVQFKILLSYPLPGEIFASSVFQSTPGIPYTATYNATNAEILPSLGRPLSGGARTAPVALFNNFTQFEEQRINQLDLRLSRLFRVGGLRIEGGLDLYNLLNASPVLTVNNTYGASWRNVIQALDSRMLRWSARVEF